MPALRLARLVLECESEDGTTLLDCVGPFGFGGGERFVDCVEGCGGGECACGLVRRGKSGERQEEVLFLRDIVAVVEWFSDCVRWGVGEDGVWFCSLDIEELGNE